VTGYLSRALSVSRVDTASTATAHHEENAMFPTTTDVVTAERTHRLEGYRRWSRRHGQVAGREADDTEPPAVGHRPVLRLALGR
jgi:hypothetical protein